MSTKHDRFPRCECDRRRPHSGSESFNAALREVQAELVQSNVVYRDDHLRADGIDVSLLVAELGPRTAHREEEDVRGRDDRERVTGMQDASGDQVSDVRNGWIRAPVSTRS